MGKRLFPQTLGAPGVALEKMGTINKLSEETNKFKIDKKSRRRLKKHTTEYLPKIQIATKTDEFLWNCISTLSNF